MQSIITDSTITLISETGPSVIGKTHPNFYKIKKYNRYSIIDRITKNYFYNHMPLCDVKNLIKPTTFKNLFKFTFVRHPFDQFLSLYLWANEHNEKKFH